MGRLILVILFVMMVGSSYGEDAKELFKKYGCDGCHSDYGIIAGPAFYMVKKKYLKEFKGDKEALKKYLYNTIRKGSKGKWFDFLDMQMPSHPQIKEDEMKVIVEYIANLKQPEQEKKEKSAK
ncbi:c-type cytochrome [Persephonella sp.]